MIWRRLYHILWTQGYGGDSVSPNPSTMAVIAVKRKGQKDTGSTRSTAKLHWSRAFRSSNGRVSVSARS